MSPYSSDGGGEENGSGGVWSHIGEGARGGEAHTSVCLCHRQLPATVQLHVLHPLPQHYLYLPSFRFLGCRPSVWRWCRGLWFSGVRSSLLRPEMASSSSASTWNPSGTWRGEASSSPHKATLPTSNPPPHSCLSYELHLVRSRTLKIKEIQTQLSEEWACTPATALCSIKQTGAVMTEVTFVVFLCVGRCVCAPNCAILVYAAALQTVQLREGHAK